jgi:hypothetical protein
MQMTGYLAQCLVALGRADEAAPLLERRLEFYEREIGLFAPQTTLAAWELVECLRVTGNDGRVRAILTEKMVWLVFAPVHRLDGVQQRIRFSIFGSFSVTPPDPSREG